MCIACYVFTCTGVTGCDEAPFGGIAPAAAIEVRDYTALLAYEAYEAARWNAMLPTVGAQVFVTYSFTGPGAIPSVQDYSPYDATGYWSFDATQRESTRAAMAELSRVSGVIFVETTGEEAMLQVFGASGSSWGGWANYPWVGASETGTGRMVIDMDGTFAPGSSAFQVILHELGHAVGLKHPFEGDTTLADDLDNTSQTLMSYTWSGGPRSEYSPLDVQALQHLYGAARDNAGWTWAMEGAVFTLTAGTAADVIVGVRTSNLLHGGGGADHVIGRGMADTLLGGAGNDTLDGGDGANRLSGGAGRDQLTGGSAADRMAGGLGNDRLTGDWGDDRLTGDAGDDRIWGDLDGSGWGKDQIRGGDGNDTIQGGADSDRIWGDAGDDRIHGDFAADGWGNDTIFGGDGHDWIHGGDGSNVLNGGEGNDTVFGGDSGHMVITGGAGDDVLHGAAPDATFAGWDTIDGGAGNDRIFGRAGSDALTGAGGRDTIYGDAGWDTLSGGSGNDRLFGGDDRDNLSGDVGNDTLDGGAGNDDLYGGTGRDVLTGGLDADRFVFTSGDVGWIDLITDFQSGVDRVVFTGLGYLRSSLTITDHANGTDSVLRAGPAGELAVQIAGIRAAEFDLFDVLV